MKIQNFRKSKYFQKWHSDQQYLFQNKTNILHWKSQKLDKEEQKTCQNFKENVNQRFSLSIQKVRELTNYSQIFFSSTNIFKNSRNRLIRNHRNLTKKTSKLRYKDKKLAE